MGKHFLNYPIHNLELCGFIFTADDLASKAAPECSALFTTPCMPGMLLIFSSFFKVTSFFILHLSALYFFIRIVTAMKSQLVLKP